jgi:anti-anti-sigma factor
MSEETVLKLAATQLKHSTIINIGNELSDAMLANLRDLILSQINEYHNKYVILILSGLKFMDSDEYSSLLQISKMAEILGAKTVFVGLNPGIIMHLINQDIDIQGIKSYHIFNDALEALGIIDDSKEDNNSELLTSEDKENNTEIQANIDHQPFLEKS